MTTITISIPLLTAIASLSFFVGMATVVLVNKRAYKKTKVCSCASDEC